MDDIYADQKNLLLMLKEEIDSGKFEESDNILKAYEDLKHITDNPTREKINSLKNAMDNLMDKYDDLYELEYYFDPLCFGLEKKIHADEVKDLRRRNREKRNNHFEL